MAIDAARNFKTIRTYPRLMEDIQTREIVTVLHDHAKPHGMVYLTGPNAGRFVSSDEVSWVGFEDLKGSVTLWNKD